MCERVADPWKEERLCFCCLMGPVDKMLKYAGLLLGFELGLHSKSSKEGMAATFAGEKRRF